MYFASAERIICSRLYIAFCTGNLLSRRLVAWWDRAAGNPGQRMIFIESEGIVDDLEEALAPDCHGVSWSIFCLPSLI